MRHQRGVSLVEVIIALALMGVILAYAAPLFATAIHENAAGADLGAVGAMAVDRMELLRGTDFYSLGAGGNLSSDVTGFSDPADPRYTVRWLVADNGSPATLKTISVRVIAARAVNGPAKEVTLVTERAR
ncbi:MAG TPA: type II secretion system protein [Dongiaceae bacterium]|nr:type II secretion system protein [Dongiaceae bacterium]